MASITPELEIDPKMTCGYAFRTNAARPPPYEMPYTIHGVNGAVTLMPVKRRDEN